MLLAFSALPTGLEVLLISVTYGNIDVRKYESLANGSSRLVDQ